MRTVSSDLKLESMKESSFGSLWVGATSMTDAKTTLPGVSRRRLLGCGAAATLSAAGYRRVLGANDRVGLGFIGFGLIGKRHVLDFQRFSRTSNLGGGRRGPPRPARRGRRPDGRRSPASSATSGACSTTATSTPWSSRRPTTGTP